MRTNEPKQITIGELKALLAISCLPDDTPVYVGFGEAEMPLRHVVKKTNRIILHPSIYEEDRNYIP